ncbi:PAS domain S-box protein [Nitratireductor aquibiodomus]|uniref:histidine kinase dimerization/phospho-acceptor domain-containing protein n=1 Tax=Nitratireductor aquibiodomus TaxID=204799 RepID=UPI0019D38725|nr:histidine kinase dimerization/phospho-acceptor domain-containing protein [Nitratireductor aquibiodomus]MBN7763986.1 PAS domain S-box protein [Nitratireductor aquibiodomus]
MASVSYSFVDIAVLDRVRERFAAGDALLVLSRALDTVIWANGPGAALIGYRNIEEAIGAESNLSATTRRQISATPGFPRISGERTVGTRLGRSMRAPVVNLEASTISLPGGEQAILLALKATSMRIRDDAFRATAAVEGFDAADQFAALVDENGLVAASSSGFQKLGIERETLRALVDEVRDETDRLVKRMVEGGARQRPAAIAKLTDEPAWHLLVVVDEQNAPLQEAPAAPTVTTTPDDAPSPLLEEPVADAPAAQTTAHDDAPTETLATETEATSAPAAPSAAREDNASPAAETVEPEAQEPTKTPQRERPTGTVRFAWRTDSEGRFTALSDAFAEAIGPAAADVMGRRFRDVSNAFGLDPEGRIATLLERRDTWSGRTVMWPLEGTDLKIPVDLAALPIYGRGRVFEGFHGFGLARMGDAVTDPEGIGLVLIPGAPLPTRPVENAETPSAPGAGSSTTALPETPESEQEPVVEAPFDADLHDAPADEAKEPAAAETEGEPEAPVKIINLSEHRTAPAKENGLSPSEATAFREIGARLRENSAQTSDADKVAASETTDEAPVEDQPAAPAVKGAVTEDSAPEAEAPAHEAEDAAPDDVSAETNEPIAESAAQAGTPIEDVHAPEPELTADDEASPSSEAAHAETTEGAEAQAAEEEAAPAASTAPVVPSAFFEKTADDREETSLLAGLPLPILIHAGDTLHFANRAFFDLTGYADLAALEENGGIGALFPESYEVSHTPADAQALTLKTAQGVEHDVHAHLQSVPWRTGKALLLALQPVEAETAEPAQEAVAAPLVSEAPAETGQTAELQMHLAEMRAIVDTATDGVVIIDNDGHVRSTNRPAEALFGFDGEDVAGKPFTALFAIESQNAVRAHLESLSDNGVASVLNDGLEVIGREAQGRFIPLFMTIGRLPHESGFCAVLRDITQWKRAAEELTQARAEAERASSQKTEFLARVSHEIRTPLNAIIGFSELMMDEKFGPIGNDRYRDYLRDINRSGNHVLDLVNDLLDISKIEAGEQEMHYEAVSLNDILGETVAMMQPQANRERVIIRSSFASNLPDVVADPRSVRQIALNLLSNAVRYTAAGGQVIVSTAYSADGAVVMRVRDTGIGMNPAEVEEALKPFKQINSLKRKRGDGTGLGLPLTRAMVEANRAAFAIHSVPGEGTLVEVSFPPTRVLAD